MKAAILFLAVLTASEPAPDRKQILAPDLAAPWRSIHCGMACGRPMGSGFRVWYTGNAKGGSGYHICRADFDGRWNLTADSGPCLEPGAQGEFDAAAAFMPCVVDPGDGGPLRMYYAAHSGGTFPGPGSSAGLATSVDGGASWVKIGHTLEATGDDHGGIGTHCVYRTAEGWAMIYTHVHGVRPKMRYFMRFAVSPDGLNWIRPPENLCLDHDGGTSARPCVWKDGSRFRMLYTHHAREGRGPNAYRVRLAESEDGLRFRDLRQFLDVAPEGFDSEMVCYPWAIPSRGVFLYTGNYFGRGGIGVAKLQLAP